MTGASAYSMIMPLTLVLVTRQWTLDRPDARALVTCAIALVQDDDDRGFYEVRVALNSELFYARMWESHEAVTADADGAVSDLLRAGWQLRGGDDGSSDYDS